MPLKSVEKVLAAGFLPMFNVETAAPSTREAAEVWAKAYTNYVVAGGIPAARAKEKGFAKALTAAFEPTLGGGGKSLFLAAMKIFWIGLPVPAQAGAVSIFAPRSTNVDSPQPGDATPQDQANALAKMIAGLTLGAVKVQPFAPGPPVPLA